MSSEQEVDTLKQFISVVFLSMYNCTDYISIHTTPTATSTPPSPSSLIFPPPEHSKFNLVQRTTHYRLSCHLSLDLFFTLKTTPYKRRHRPLPLDYPLVALAWPVASSIDLAATHTLTALEPCLYISLPLFSRLTAITRQYASQEGGPAEEEAGDGG